MSISPPVSIYLNIYKCVSVWIANIQVPGSNKVVPTSMCKYSEILDQGDCICEKYLFLKTSPCHC